MNKRRKLVIALGAGAPYTRDGVCSPALNTVPQRKGADKLGRVRISENVNSVCAEPYRLRGTAPRTILQLPRSPARGFFAKGYTMFRTSIDNPLRAAATAAILAICLVFGACSERMNREDFVTLLKGKTEQEVLKIEGKPTTVDDKKSDRRVWTYTSRTFDVNNQNKMDAKTIVIFSQSAEGKMVVTQVLFE